MAEKSTKIDDVKRPDKVAPEATSRPLLVTNRPTLTNDPMISSPSNEDNPDGQAGMPMTHTAKTIKPLDSTLEAAQKDEATPEENAGDTAASERITEGQAKAEKSTELGVQAEPEPKFKLTAPVRSSTTPGLAVTADSDDESDSRRDPDAAISAEDAAAAEAKAKREEELEGLIASGKYAVPINAVSRKRSRTNSIILSLLAILLAILLLDVAVDVGIMKVPSGIPHTHFFSKQ